MSGFLAKVYKKGVIAGIISFILVVTIQSVYANPPFKVNAKAAVVIDALSGQIVYEQDADRKIPPASLTKLMTLYVTFDAVDQGLVSLDDKVSVSKKAWSTGGSKMFLNVGSTVPLKTLLRGIAVVSANDACVAVAEHVAGVEEVFVEKMNRKAEALGMKNSHFMNSHGLPCKGQFVTARDMAILSYNYLKDHPEVLKIHSIKELTYNNITQRNRNGLLWLDNGVDGLKTGWFSAAGFHIVATAHRNNDRFIAVVMGAKGQRERENAAMKLLNYSFRNFKTLKVEDDKLHDVAHVCYGVKSVVPVAPPCRDIYVTVPIDIREVEVEKKLPDKVFAPIKKGQHMGMLSIIAGENVLKKFPLVALNSVEESGFLKKIFQAGVSFFLSPPYAGLLVFLLVLFVLIFLRLFVLRRRKERKKQKDVVSEL